MRGDVCAGGCQLFLSHRLSSDWPCGTFQFKWAAFVWAALRTRPCRVPIYNAGEGGSLKPPS